MSLDCDYLDEQQRGGSALKESEEREELKVFTH